MVSGPDGRRETGQVARTMTGLEPLVAEDTGPRDQMLGAETTERGGPQPRGSYFMEMPYWDTCSYPDFHTSVTSQALVAWSRHERKAETAFPPTEHTLISSLSSVVSAIVTALSAGTCVWSSVVRDLQAG